MLRRVVVLPQPDGPSSAINSPSRTSRSRSPTATTLPKRLVRPRRLIADIRRRRGLAGHLLVPAVDQLAPLLVEPDPVPEEDLRDVGLRGGHDGPQVVGHLHL